MAGVARAPPGLWRLDSDSDSVTARHDLTVPFACFGCCEFTCSSNIHEFPARCCTSVLYNGFNANFMLAFHTGCRGLNAKAVRCFLSGELHVKLMELGG